MKDLSKSEELHRSMLIARWTRIAQTIALVAIAGALWVRK